MIRMNWIASMMRIAIASFVIIMTVRRYVSGQRKMPGMLLQTVCTVIIREAEAGTRFMMLWDYSAVI